MEQTINNIYDWVLTQEYWLQKIVKTFAEQNRVLSEEELKVTYNEHRSGNQNLIISKSDFVHRFNSSDTRNITVSEISDVQGINRLNPRNPLKISEGNLFVVYGRNGTGKSGYVRLLKQICGAKKITKIHDNVFSEEQVLAKAKLSYTIDGVKKTVDWSAGQVLNDLKSIDIYDTSVGLVYVNENNTISYEPLYMKFFAFLSRQSEKYRQVLLGIKEELQQKAESLTELIPIHDSKPYKQIFSESSDLEQRIKKIHELTWNEEQSNKLSLLKKQADLTETRLRIQSLTSLKGRLDSVLNTIRQYSEKFNQESTNKYITARQMVDVEKKKVQEIGRLLKDQEFDSIGSDTWRSLWASAKLYSKTEVYKGIEFPNVEDSALCLLCQQPYSESAKVRMITLEKFVQDQANTKFKEESVKLETLKSNFPTRLNIESVIGSIKTIENIDKGFLNSFTNKLTTLCPVIDAFILNPNTDLYEILKSSADELKTYIDAIAKQITQLNTLINKEEIEKINTAILDLEGCQKLHGVAQKIKDSFQNEKSISLVDSALEGIRATKRNISIASSRVAELVLTEELKTNFQTRR